MGDSRSWAADNEEEEFWESDKGKDTLKAIEASNALLEDWNSAVEQINDLKMSKLTVGDYRFLESCHYLEKASTAWYAHDAKNFVDPEKLARLKTLVMPRKR